MGQAIGGMFNPDVANPNQAKWGDLDSSEKGARLLAGGTKGLAQGFSNMQGQNQQMRQGGPSMPVPMPQQPQVQLPGMGDSGQMNNPTKRIYGNNLAFYGGQ